MKTFSKILFLWLIILTCSLPAGKNRTNVINSEEQSLSSKKIVELTDLCWKNRSSAPLLALKCGHEAISLAKENDLLELIPKASNMVGVVYRNIGKLDSSYIFYKNALEIAEEIKDSIQIAYSYNNIGGYHRLMGAHSEAINYMIKAMKIFENNNDERGAGFCAINIGILFRRQFDYQKAYYYLDQSVEIRKNIGDKHGLALSLNQLAEVHFETANYEEALKSYNNLIQLYGELDEQKGMAAVYAGIAGVYYELEKYFVSLDYRLKSIRIDRNIDNKYGIATNLNNIGKIFVKLNKLVDAEANFLKALELSIETGYHDLEMHVNHNLAELSKLTGNYKRACEYFTRYDVLEDSLFKASKIEKVNELQTAYEMEKKELENSSLKKSYELEITLRYLWILIILLVTSLLIVNWRRYRNNKEANELLKELNLTKDKFLKYLLTTLKNPFNSILGYSEILTEDFNEMRDEEKLKLIKEINSSSHKLHNLLENILKWADSQSGTLQGVPAKIEIKLVVDDIIHLFENVANDKEVIVINKIMAKQKILADINMVQFIFRNLLNNAIKYSSRGGVVEFDARGKNNDTVVISVKDNGIGISSANREKVFKLDEFHTTIGTANEKGTGLGLILVKELVEKNNGKIWFESNENEGTTFFVSFHKTN